MNFVRKPPIPLSLLAAVVASMGLSACGGNDDNVATAPPPTTQAPLSCVQLNGMPIPAASIGLPTTGATVTSTEVVAATGTGTAAVGEYCKVLGDINPVDPTAPKIKFQLNLPTNWNNKVMMFGGGGYNGTISTGVGNVPAGPADQLTPLGRGYATFSSDSGHQADATTSRDGRFGQNDEALNNFGSDALKKTRDVAMSLINMRYASKPQRAYFAGGSTGGREALLAVSNWPQDWDGAIVLYPAWDAVSLDLHFGNMTRELAKPGAYPNEQKRAALFEASLQACDALDGVADRVVSNTSACNATFEPATATLNGLPLRCAGGADTGNACLSDAQINSFKVLNSPTRFNYALASGETSYPGFNAWGSDFGRTLPNDATAGQKAFQPTIITLALGTDQPAFPMPGVTSTTSPPYGSTFWDQWVRYFVTRNANFNSLTLDPANPGTFQSRIVQLSGIQEAYKADLSAFQAKGGKILMAHGTNDVLVSNRATQRYFQRLQTAMGNDKVKRFLRYYEIPGYGHAASTVFNAAWDSLTTLESWVERGTTPGAQIVTDTVGVSGRTRPLCEYLTFPRYNGSGDVNLAASYSCATQ
jgi:feruloyl esterase